LLCVIFLDTAVYIIQHIILYCNQFYNTNNITIQHISPFGFEDVRKIPLPEMKTILRSGLNAGILIIKEIYNQIENKFLGLIY
jgi:hypothetical protein